MKAQVRSLLLAGILPVVAFSLIEDHYGTLWGLVAGMVFGVGEIIYEAVTLYKVDPMTWGGNGLLLVLGAISLISHDGLWFKLQPAMIEAFMAVALVGSVLVNRPLMLAMAKKQGIPPESQKILAPAFRGMTLRMGLFFAFHAVLATWAALKWSTTAWAWLKGAGFTGSMIAYSALEAVWLRRGAKLRLAQQVQVQEVQSPRETASP